MGQSKTQAVVMKILPVLDGVVGAVLSQAVEGGAHTLRDLCRAIIEKRSELTGALLQAVVEQLHARELKQRTTRCAHCHKYLFRKRLQAREISTLLGCFVLRRPYFYCPRCQHGFCPLDAVLDLAPDVHQYDVQEKLTVAAARLPYQEATALFTDLTGVAVGEHCAHDIVQRLGTAATAEEVLPSRAEIEQRIEQARAGSSRRPVLIASADGAHAPIRAPQTGRKGKRGPGQWYEVKGFRLFLLGVDARIIPLANWHQIGGPEPLADVLRVLAARIPAEKVRMVLVGDGAPWLWNVLGNVFPDATQVLDRYHCSQYLWRVAREQFPDQDQQARRWVGAILARLDVDEVPEAIGDILELSPTSPQANHKLDALVDYLDEHIDRFDYDRCKRRGMPIGSGGMESANRFIMQVRIKLPGAWWIKNNCNTILRIRCALYNGTYRRVFNSYVARRPERHIDPDRLAA